MNTLTLKALKIDNKLSIKNLIIKKLKWYKNPNLIFYTILSLSSISYFYYIRDKNYPIIVLSISIFLGVSLFILLNYINRLTLKTYGIKNRKSLFFWYFPQNKYEKKHLNLFYKKLISKKIMKGNENDISRIKLIEEDILNSLLEPKKTYILQVFVKKSWPIIMGLYLTYVTLILTNTKNIIADSKLILAYSILILAFISQILFLNYLTMDFLNKKYRDQQRFLKKLTNLKIKLKLKYTIE